MAEAPTQMDVRAALFLEPEVPLYCVLDGASIEGLLGALRQHRPEHCCLYSGELEPALAEAAPYLVRMDPDSPFTDWVLSEGWGRHWGIFARCAESLRPLRKHLRSLLRVRDPKGKVLMFRFYDPRVLRVFLPTCNEAELQPMFGPVQAYLMEDQSPDALLHFGFGLGALQRRTISLAAATGAAALNHR